MTIERIHVDMSVDHQQCLRCNRKLKAIKARVLGYGRVCYKKHLIEMAEMDTVQADIDQAQGDAERQLMEESNPTVGFM